MRLDRAADRLSESIAPRQTPTNRNPTENFSTLPGAVRPSPPRVSHRWWSVPCRHEAGPLHADASIDRADLHQYCRRKASASRKEMRNLLRASSPRHRLPFLEEAFPIPATAL